MPLLPARPWTRGFTTLGNIVAFTVGAGTFLMALSMFAGTEATKNVLPFATGLIGFLGGMVTSMYKDDTTPKPTKPESPERPAGPTQIPKGYFI